MGTSSVFLIIQRPGRGPIGTYTKIAARDGHAAAGYTEQGSIEDRTAQKKETSQHEAFVV